MVTQQAVWFQIHLPLRTYLLTLTTFFTFPSSQYEQAFGYAIDWLKELLSQYYLFTQELEPILHAYSYGACVIVIWLRYGIGIFYGLVEAMN